MTKILFWNIEQFNNAKIASAGNGPDLKAGGLTLAQAATDRRNLIYQVLAATDPDIFVIIEVLATRNKTASTASDNGGLAGAAYLLSQLRDVQNGNAPQNVRSADWRLVPPLWLNKETIAVFYRGTTGNVDRYFTGPNVWSGGNKGKTRLPGTVQAAAYNLNPNPQAPVSNFFNDMLVPTGTNPRIIPAGAQHHGTGAVAENTVAGRVTLFQTVPQQAPAAVDFGNAASPFLVTFSEFIGVNVQRDITLFAVHLPADPQGQATFINRLAGTDEINANMGGMETRLVGGDFNIGLLDDNGVLTTAYDPLIALHYDLLLVPAGQPPQNVDAYRGYFATHMIPGFDRQPNQQLSKLLWSNNQQDLAYYPGYGYIGQPQTKSSFDNILVRPKLQPQNHNYRTTIMNLVTGSPLTAVNNPDGDPPVGTLALATGLGNIPQAWTPWPKAPTAPDYDQGAANQLFGWTNYTRIYSTSDHFALYAEI